MLVLGIGQWTLCGTCRETSTVQVAIGSGIGRMCLLRGHYLLCVLDFICELMLGHIASGFAAAQWKAQVPAMARMRWKTTTGAIGPQAPICQCSRMKGWLRSASVSMARSSGSWRSTQGVAAARAHSTQGD